MGSPLRRRRIAHGQRFANLIHSAGLLLSESAQQRLVTFAVAAGSLESRLDIDAIDLKRTLGARRRGRSNGPHLRPVPQTGAITLRTLDPSQQHAEQLIGVDG